MPYFPITHIPRVFENLSQWHTHLSTCTSTLPLYLHTQRGWHPLPFFHKSVGCRSPVTPAAGCKGLLCLDPTLTQSCELNRPEHGVAKERVVRMAPPQVIPAGSIPYSIPSPANRKSLLKEVICPGTRGGPMGTGHRVTPTKAPSLPKLQVHLGVYPALTANR